MAFKGWDGLRGLVALFNNSPCIPSLNGLAIGEANSETYEQTVMIRESGDGSSAVLTGDTDSKKLSIGQHYS